MAKALAIEVPISARDLTSAGFTSAERASQRFAQTATRALGMAEGAASGLGGLLFGLEGSVIGIDRAMVRWVASGLRDAIQGAREYANQVQRASANTGASVEAIQELQFAFRDVSPEEVNKGLEKLAQMMGEGLRKPASETGKLFKELGIDLRDTAGHAKTTDAVMLELSDRFRGMSSEADRTAVAAKLLGEETGKKLAKEMAIGSEAIRQQMAEAQHLGLVMSSDNVAAAKKFDDAMTRLTMAGNALSREFASSLMPWLTDVTNAMLRGYQAGGLLAGAIEAVGVAIGTLPSSRVDGLQIQLGELGDEIQKLETSLRVQEQAASANALSQFDKRGQQRMAALRQQITSLRAVQKDLQEQMATAIAPSTSIAGRKILPPSVPAGLVDVGSGGGTGSDDIAKRVAEAQKKLAEAKADAFGKLKIQEEAELRLVEGSEAGKAAVKERYVILAQQKFDEMVSKQMESEQKAADVLSKQHEDNLRKRQDLERRHTEEVARIRNESTLGSIRDPIQRDRRRAEIQFDEKLGKITSAQEAFNLPGEEGMDEEARLQNLQAALEAERVLRQEHSVIVGNIDKAAQAARWKKQDDDRKRSAMTFGALSEMAIAFGKQGHAAQKGFAIAEALINTYTGVTAALRQGPRGIPAAALILAQGLKQVSSIKSTNPGAGGSAGGGSFGNIGSPPAERGESPFNPAAPIPQVAASAGTTIIYKVDIHGSVVREQELQEKFLRFAEQESASNRSSLQLRRQA